MRKRILFYAGSLIIFAVLFSAAALATQFGSIHGIVHDPQHRPVAGAEVKVKSATSDWSQTAQTDQDGEFAFPTVPVGDYGVTVGQTGFASAEVSVTVLSSSSSALHFQLKVAAVNETVTVTGQAETANVETATPTTLLNREDVARTPGADRSNSLAIITDFVPGAYSTHDQLHVRGGHQVTWEIDGVAVPNTNIGSNVGPQFDPKDIDYLEVQRGSYEAGDGDRTYGVFNVVPRSGFERNNEAELISSFGNFYQTNDQINFGSHTDRFAYYVSANGNRSNLGLQTPVGQIIHDAENGYGGFGSLIFNASPADQFRLVTSLRRDYYQIPNTPGQQAADGEHESDAFVNLSWVRTLNSHAVLTVAPFYHFNSANFEGGPNDFPISTTDERGSTYAGGQASINVNFAKNEAQAGFNGFQQHDNQTFGLAFNDGSSTNFSERLPVTGAVEAVYIQDRFKVTSWLTLIAGVRQTHFSSRITEDATSPRYGVAVRVPKLKWVFRGFYGKYYQAPPLITATGPLLNFVTSQQLGFIPLHGEQDKEYQIGVSAPFGGWSVDVDTFRTRATNFFDHNNVGNSNVFFPITVAGALIRSWELTLRSPRLWRKGQFHLAYANQVAQGNGGVSGGLTNFSPPQGFFTLDHDQRNTLNTGFDMSLPWRSFASTNMYYGSGFSNGNTTPDANGILPPDHLPGHTTFDLSMGKSFGERVSASVSALNVANRHLLLDNSLTFGGFHFNNPREIFVELRYRFHYGSAN